MFRKRFERAESEYINAKVHLHDKTEVKDQLTEHLCSIIQQNEERKAKKLAELMARLELGDQKTNLENETDQSACKDLEEQTALTFSTVIKDNKLTPLEQKDFAEKESKTSSASGREQKFVPDPGKNSEKQEIQKNGVQHDTPDSKYEVAQEENKNVKREPGLVDIKEEQEKIEKS